MFGTVSNASHSVGIYISAGGATQNPRSRMTPTKLLQCGTPSQNKHAVVKPLWATYTRHMKLRQLLLSVVLSTTAIPIVAVVTAQLMTVFGAPYGAGRIVLATLFGVTALNAIFGAVFCASEAHTTTHDAAVGYGITGSLLLTFGWLTTAQLALAQRGVGEGGEVSLFTIWTLLIPIGQVLLLMAALTAPKAAPKVTPKDAAKA